MVWVYRLVLASTSPRRRELLALLGSPFVARPPAVDEGSAAEPARAKARAIDGGGATVLVADTRIRLGDDDIGKPRDTGEAVATLLRLADTTHLVVSEIAVVDAAGREAHFAVATRVRMRAFDSAAAKGYVATGEALDAAGAYQVPGAGGRFVDAVEGCLANVVGLPIRHVYEALRRAGRALAQRPE